MSTRSDLADWWRGAIVYHIYPRSYLDATGDGVGDLQGIIQRLDYIAELGVDAVWISPFVKSPMLDYGYDVSDYLQIDPLFGTMEDFQLLLQGAHDRGIKVLMDQVLSHTSDKHPWFLESRSGRDNAKSDWYVWADPKEDGSAPNNWISVFGGQSWQWEPRRRQYYMHNFLRQQPDLNYHNPDVRQAVLEVCRFWLDMGVDGFRLDVCAFYFHDRQLRDNPPSKYNPLGTRFMFNPYGFQRHIHDIAQEENLQFLEELRSLCDSYGDRVLLGELHENDAERLHRTYTAPGRLQLAYGYWLLAADKIDSNSLEETARALGYALDDGWPCWAVDNHDFTRSGTRLGRSRPLIALLCSLMCLRGAMCLYQGAELGLGEADIPFEKLRDPYGIEFYPSYLGRDGARTPMPWDADQEHCGFSTAEPWLPIPEAHRPLAVAAQDKLPGSTLSRIRQFIHWRKDIEPIRTGEQDFVELGEGLLALRRSSGRESVLCVFNLSDEARRFELPEDQLGTPMTGHGFSFLRNDCVVTLAPDEAYFGHVS